MRERNIAIILGILCFLLTVGICVQVKTVTNSSTSVGKTYTENELRDSVLKWQEKYEEALATLETKEAKLDKLRENAAESDESSTTITEELSQNNAALRIYRSSWRGYNNCFKRW